MTSQNLSEAPVVPRWIAMQVAVVRVLGADGVDLLHRLCTQNLRPLSQPGASAHALFVTNLGKLVQRATLWSCADGLYVSVPAGQGAGFVAFLQGYTIVEDVQYEVVGEQVPCALLWWTATAGSYALASPVAPGQVRPMEALAAEQVPGFLLPAPRGLGEGVWLQGMDPGAAATLQGVLLPALWAQVAGVRLAAASQALGPPLSAAAWRHARLQAGIPAFEEDYRAGVMPFEHRLGVGALAWNKGCYVGQEVLSRLDSYNKVARITLGLDIAAGGEDVLAQAVGDIKVAQQGRTVGRVSSWAADPAEVEPGGAVALAVLKQACAIADTQVVLRSQDAAGMPLPEVAATLRERAHWLGEVAAGLTTNIPGL